ncbi:hypothetical protein [Streptomyces sp. NPDC001315]|uniref:hypothetical protein n=1 Tax=Streptomyces sp. NPDC001315 TaxID=3364562 RepID=UPI0036CF8214
MSERQPRTLRISKPEDRAGWVVELDGHDIARSLIGLDLRVDSEPMARVTLDILAEELPGEIGQVHAYLPDATKELLVRLGWTPPAEEAS